MNDSWTVWDDNGVVCEGLDSDDAKDMVDALQSAGRDDVYAEVAGGETYEG